ncbi:uncharacterized protein KQ657_000930 [Scheffersomyces spartinae]|uniref:Nucleolar protein 19 n=1 Tax=Scheffersomyces spartinae TaxID=45513 RepID=A0A9P7V8D8_9ASCO|nr:uncharacterized protein KQ657_000930 [Scheffersomyces spartinae]KAG7193176.1 hypothetical protein KQ657_000930 [Scheffersomyces spartinae]
MSSRANRRKEIQEKQDLQAKFQLSIQQMNTKVSNWLSSPEKKEAQPEIPADNPFLQLPIIPQGGTLSNMKDLSTVKDFVEGDGKKPHGIEKDKKTSTSQPMTALLNRIRDEQRRNTANKFKANGTGKVHKDPLNKQKAVTIKKIHDIEDDDDEISNKHRHRAVTKSSGLQFGKKKRPF